MSQENTDVIPTQNEDTKIVENKVNANNFNSNNIINNNNNILNEVQMLK